jgi:nicotinamide-nucleotide amidase
MKAEIICVGTELLLGDIVNTNAAFIARELAMLGIDTYHQSVVGDNAERLRESLALSLSRSDMVITTGGLGPTCDDLTKQSVADFFGLGMETHEPSMKKIEAFAAARHVAMTQSNALQACVPAGGRVFFNDEGFAPGIAVEQNGKIVIMLPGPPKEMEPMFTSHIAPYLMERTHATILSHTLFIFGMGESAVEEKLRDIMTGSSNPTVAPYAKQGEVQVRVSAKADSAEQAERMIAPVLEEIRKRLGGVVYGVDAGSLQNAAVAALSEKNLTVAAAESCTGGGISRALTDIPGASKVFGCGIVAYDNDIKVKLLGVKKETLERFGAVSAQTAREMAAGVRAASGADVGVSVTGIAGPEGGSADKPVGLVYIAVDSDAYCDAKELRLSRGHKNERGFIRSLAVTHALSLIRTAALKAWPPCF